MSKKVSSLAEAFQILAAKIGLHDTRVYAELAKGYAEDARDMIHDRTKDGLGVDQMGGTAAGLKPLSDRYIKARKRMRLHPTTSPATSNLTKSGQMLDDMQARTQGGSWFVGFRTRRSAKVAGYVEEGGRPFLFLAASELRLLAVSFKTRFAALVKRRLK